MLAIMYKNSMKMALFNKLRKSYTYANGNMPPTGTNSFILRYHGYGGISLDNLFTLPGFLIAVFLKPKKEPSQTFGTDNMQ